MSSDAEPPGEAFVWIWLPGASEPVVAGRLDEVGAKRASSTGGATSSEECDLALTPELPLTEERIRPLAGLDAPGCILDARPDAWGQRVIMNRLIGPAAAEDGPGGPRLERAFARVWIGPRGRPRLPALRRRLRPREREHASLDELATSAQRVEEGIPLSPALDAALLRGSSIGGARPKALIDDGQRRLIAKFTSRTDTFGVEQGEYVAMELAHRAGLKVARVELTQALKRKVLLVERFDRIPGTEQRRSLVSALTMLGLNELAARHASYAELAQIMRASFTDPGENLRELFARITFNILVGNTDDHARNHAAFWDGQMPTLTPAYDICPQARNTGRATQAMIIGDAAERFKESQVAGCVERAHLYQLSKTQAMTIVDHQIDVINSNWADVCEQAELTETDRSYFWKRQFLNDYALEGWPSANSR